MQQLKSANCLGIAVLLMSLGLLTSSVAAQESAKLDPKEVSITASVGASSDRVRIAGPATVVQMRIEIYATSGIKLLDDEIRGGNVFDWYLQDSRAQRLSAGEYVCVVTVKNIAGKLTQKIGVVQVGEKDIQIGRAEAAQLSLQQSQAVGPIEEDSSWTIATADQNQTTTVIAHDGTEGQLVRGRGALSFRLGDFFSGKDVEQMRLTEAGNLGIGTPNPQVKLDVAGTIRAERVLISRAKSESGSNSQTDSTAQTTSTADSVQPLVSGTGTANKLTKWLDNAGTLSDSVVSETSGNIGINTSTPAAALHVNGNQFINPVGAIPTYEVLAGSDPTSTVMLTTNGSAFG